VLGQELLDFLSRLPSVNWNVRSAFCVGTIPKGFLELIYENDLTDLYNTVLTSFFIQNPIDPWVHN